VECTEYPPHLQVISDPRHIPSWAGAGDRDGPTIKHSLTATIGLITRVNNYWTIKEEERLLQPQCAILK
jgi:hypothetical protein